MTSDGTFSREALQAVAHQLLGYCRERDWLGYDPYDALNSEFLRLVPFADSRLPRLAMTQLFKRSPINLRSVFRVRQLPNPKAIALFLMTFVKLARAGLDHQGPAIRDMADKLIALRSPAQHYWCWGYSFPWQTRTMLIPRHAPNLVSTTFVGNALLDAYEECAHPQYLHAARGAGDYIVRKLYWTDGAARASFAYPAESARTPVHNANFLGAAFLCRLHSLSPDKELLDAALRVARYSAGRQRGDGAWDYGESSTQRWIDNFHTGYNLCALRSIASHTRSSEFDEKIARGFTFYRERFFTDQGAPKYFHDRTYPVDIHSAAQSVITLVALQDLHESSIGLAHRVLAWTLRHMWDARGFFYYQSLPRYTNKIPYMRWSQAWMALALGTLIEESVQRTASLRSAA